MIMLICLGYWNCTSSNHYLEKPHNDQHSESACTKILVMILEPNNA